jgi:DNA-binding transcriptional LysR family regulator
VQVDLIDLRLVILIAEEGSLSRAAERAHLTLSAVSLRIKALEERAGVRIFYRESGGAKLSPAGEVLLVHARNVITEISALDSELSEYSRELRGHMRIFANTTAVTDFLPEITRTFLKLNPHVNVHIQERMNEEIARAVQDGGADFGVAAGDIKFGPLQAIHLTTDRLVLVVPAEHPLAAKHEVPFLSTLAFDHVALREGSTLHAFMAKTAAAEGVELRIRTQVQSFEALARMVEANVGIGVLPESSALRYSSNMDVKLVAIQEEWSVRKRFVLVRDLNQLPSYMRDYIELTRTRLRGSAAGT